MSEDLEPRVSDLERSLADLYLITSAATGALLVGLRREKVITRDQGEAIMNDVAKIVAESVLGLEGDALDEYVKDVMSK